jgi:thymidine kinase
MPGRIELICGCMFSGKTERLIERVALAQAQGVSVAVFKHALDDRYGPSDLISHSGRRSRAIPIDRPELLAELAHGARLIVVDEAQFFSDGLVQVCRLLADRGAQVVLAGLDRDSWGLPFGAMPALRAAADTVLHTTATCAACGESAEYTYRRIATPGAKMVAAADCYEPRCGRCFEAPPMELRC